MDTEDGCSVGVGPDRDGLGCVEIHHIDDKGAIMERITFCPEQALLVADAMIKCANELKKS